MIDVIANFFANIISDILTGWIKKTPSEQKKRYEEIRQEIAEALSMYACCFHNPVDIAFTNEHKMPIFYDEGSKKIRCLAAKIEAFAETMPKGKTDVPVSITELRRAGRCLFGISNSFHTPYGTGASVEKMRNVDSYENELRTILDLPKRE